MPPCATRQALDLCGGEGIASHAAFPMEKRSASSCAASRARCDPSVNTSVYTNKGWAVSTLVPSSPFGPGDRRITSGPSAAGTARNRRRRSAEASATCTFVLSPRKYPVSRWDATPPPHFQQPALSRIRLHDVSTTRAGSGQFEKESPTEDRRPVQVSCAVSQAPARALTERPATIPQAGCGVRSNVLFLSYKRLTQGRPT
jgi:hypothetical protein